jgi:hypothetical protein
MPDAGRERTCYHCEAVCSEQIVNVFAVVA